MHAKHRRMVRLQHLAITQIHVHAARQAGVEAAHRTHDIYALEFFRTILFEDRRVLHRIFVGTGGAIDVTRIGIPRSWRIGMVIGDFALTNYDVMGEYAPHRFVETAADGFFRHLEIRPGFGMAGMELFHRFLGEVQSAGCGVGLEVGASPVAFDGVAPLWNLPLELDFWLGCRLGQINLYAFAGGFDVAD